MRKAEFYHSGIKGQKKGIRRFQFANKSYTPAGNARYRPKKDVNPVVPLALAGSGAFFGVQMAKAIAASGASATSSAISAKLAATGAAAVSAIMSVPAPVFALTLPVAVVGAGYGVIKTKEALEKVKDFFL